VPDKVPDRGLWIPAGIARLDEDGSVEAHARFD
jgi:hypothetical protein